eukprot:3787976-Pyramimonas_sp.AAC.1
MPPREKTDSSYKNMLVQEKQFSHQLQAHSRVSSQWEYHTGQIKSITDSLEEHEAEYKLATIELHAGNAGTTDAIATQFSQVRVPI